MDSSDAISSLPNEIIKNVLKEIIKKNVNTENYDVQIESGSSKGDNFIGIVYRVTVKPHHSRNLTIDSEKHESTCQELSIILKLPPQNAIRRKQFFARSTFIREALVYDEILPLYMDFQMRKGINLGKSGFYEVPKCLGTVTEDGYEAIFLEDLKPKGFQMFNRLETITIDHVKIVIQVIAKLHAVSFALKDQCPEVYDKYKSIPDIFYERKGDDQLSSYFDSLKKRAIESLCPDTDNAIITKINSFFGKNNYIDIMLKLVCGQRAEPYAILCHGDCWNNNILFKYENDRPVEARLIDWQISRYASPITDLMYYLFTCTTQQLRDVHYKSLMDFYHNELSSLLKSLGSDPEKVFPRRALDDQLNKFGVWGLMMSMMLLPIITSYAEDIPDLDELSEQLDSGNLDADTTFKPKQTYQVYQERMRGVILNMIELGYL